MFLARLRREISSDPSECRVAKLYTTAAFAWREAPKWDRDSELPLAGRSCHCSRPFILIDMACEGCPGPSQSGSQARCWRATSASRFRTNPEPRGEESRRIWNAGCQAAAKDVYWLRLEISSGQAIWISYVLSQRTGRAGCGLAMARRNESVGKYYAVCEMGV
jgi:hypothetical protein